MWQAEASAAYKNLTPPEVKALAERRDQYEKETQRSRLEDATSDKAVQLSVDHYLKQLGNLVRSI